MPNTSSHKAVLVTGASRGLGLETALLLAGAGFTVWAGSRNPDIAEMQSMAAKRNVRLNVLSLDVTSDESVRAAFRQIETSGVPLFGIVNNAGITGRCWFEDYPEENIRETTLLADYEVIGDLTLDAVRTIRTPTLLMYGDQSHFLSSFEVLRYIRPGLPRCNQAPANHR